MVQVHALIYDGDSVSNSVRHNTFGPCVPVVFPREALLGALLYPFLQSLSYALSNPKK